MWLVLAGVSGVWSGWCCKNYVKICTHITLTYVYIYFVSLVSQLNKLKNCCRVCRFVGMCVCWRHFTANVLQRINDFPIMSWVNRIPFPRYIYIYYIDSRALLCALDVGVVCASVRGWWSVYVFLFFDELEIIISILSQLRSDAARVYKQCTKIVCGSGFCVCVVLIVCWLVLVGWRIRLQGCIVYIIYIWAYRRYDKYNLGLLVS